MGETESKRGARLGSGDPQGKGSPYRRSPENGARHSPARPPAGGPAERRATLSPTYVELKRRADELERSNAELDAFGRGLAHDLSEGLATVALFAEALETRLLETGSGHGLEDYGLDERTARDLNGIQAGIERVQSLISEALRSGGHADAEHHRPVDANAALRDALANVQARLEQAGAEVVSEPLPWVSGSRPELTRLLQNLLANSIKFRDPRRPARIRVGARREGRRWRFEVADNGIGIEAEVAEGQPDAPSLDAGERARPGGRLGLTLCRRIVEAHGGQVRLEPRSEGGTTVSFDLPALEVRSARLRRQSWEGAQE